MVGLVRSLLWNTQILSLLLGEFCQLDSKGVKMGRSNLFVKLEK